MDISQNRTILVIDDYQDNLFFIKLFLENEGYEVKLAASGQQGLAEIAQACPSLILLDLMMPDMTGIEVVEKIKADCDLPRIPIILFTADRDFPAENSPDIDEVVHKPVDIDELRAKIELVLCAEHSNSSTSA